MFCVECGADGPTVDGLCARCFSKRHRIVEPPAAVDLARCAHCGNVQLASGWTRTDLDLAIPRLLAERVAPLRPFARATFTHVARQEDPNNFLLTVKASARHEAFEVVQDFHTRLRLKPATCDTCTKERSAYYQGILQVRGDGRDLTPKEIRAVRTFVQARIDRGREARGDFASKVEEIHGGLDFYVSTNALVKALAREVAEAYAGTVSSSPKLYGQRGGAEVYRVTSLVRLNPFHVGDVVRHKGALHEVVKLGAFATLRDLVTGEQRRFKPRDLRAARIVDAERFEADLRAADGEIVAAHPESGAERALGTRNAKPGRGVVLWAADGAYVSSLPAVPSKD
jgi:nonsense-mediated mRNA decay protein 3